MSDFVYSSDVLAAAGISYRQLDHWCRRGFARPINDDPGYGHSRVFSRGELSTLTRMGRLVAAGVRPEVAHAIARGDADAAAQLLTAIEMASEAAA